MSTISSPIPDGQISASSLNSLPINERPLSTTRDLDRIDARLAGLTQLAERLLADPDRHVQRSIEELRAAFASRGAMEPAVARVRRSLTMLRSANHDGSRREFERRAEGLDRISELVEHDLLPDLRRIGFDV